MMCVQTPAPTHSVTFDLDNVSDCGFVSETTGPRMIGQDGALH